MHNSYCQSRPVERPYSLPSLLMFHPPPQSDLERFCEYPSACSVLQEEVTKVESGLQLDLNLEKSRIKEEVRTTLAH